MARKKSIDTNIILDAAETVLLSEGIRHFTLDSVATQAAVSKGGLTYSFPSKEALIDALITREMTRFIRQTRKQALAWLPHPQAKLLGYIDATRDEDYSVSARAISLLTVLSQAPELMGTVSNIYRNTLDEISNSTSDARRARLAFFVTEGVFLLQGMGILQMQEHERRSVLEDAKSLCRLNGSCLDEPPSSEVKRPVVTGEQKFQIRSLKRSELIVEAAFQIISREGIHALTHRAVASEAGVPLGSTTYHFRDLDDLLNAVVLKAISVFREEMQRWFKQHHGTKIQDVLAEFIITKINDMSELSREYEVFAAAISRPSMRPYALAWSDTVIEVLETAVPEEVALSLGTVMNGFLIRGLLEGRNCTLSYKQIHKVISALLPSFS